MKYSELATKAARISFLKEKLATNPKWAVRGLLRIYENQTNDEQRSGLTKYHNGIGFTGADSELLSSFAEQILAGRTMSPRQMYLIHRKMPKYARQLETVSR